LRAGVAILKARILAYTLGAVDSFLSEKYAISMMTAPIF
jgi:hypothetical protein